MDHFVLVGLDVSEYIFTFEILDRKEGGIEGYSDLVEDCHQRSLEWSGCGREGCGTKRFDPELLNWKGAKECS